MGDEEVDEDDESISCNEEDLSDELPKQVASEGKGRSNLNGV